MDSKILSHKHYTLGTAPYKFVGLWSAPSRALLSANPSAYNQQMADAPKCCNSTCDHCGTGIAHHCIIQDATGKQFAVGTTCIGKCGAVELLSETQRAVKEMQRQKRRVIAQAKMDAHAAEYKAKLDIQRDANGGMTDSEVAENEREEKRRQRIETLAPIADVMRDGKGGFRDSVADSLEDGAVPCGRGFYLTAEIFGKAGGKNKSPEYTEAYNLGMELMEKADCIR